MLFTILLVDIVLLVVFNQIILPHLQHEKSRCVHLADEAYAKGDEKAYYSIYRHNVLYTLGIVLGFITLFLIFNVIFGWYIWNMSQDYFYLFSSTSIAT